MRSRSASDKLKFSRQGSLFGLLVALACTGPSTPPAVRSGPAPAHTHTETSQTAQASDAAVSVPVVKDAGPPDASLEELDAGQAQRHCDGGRADSSALALGADADEGGTAPPVEVPHVGADVTIPGDTPVYVLEGAPGNSRALVYLHGRCGQIYAVDAWRHAATEHGTLVALRGDRPCPEQRRRWGTDIDALHQRIQQALRVIKKRRNGELWTRDVTLFGYSQGATRAEGLARRYPRIYRRVVLGGPPTKPEPAHLARAQAVAVFGGDSETTEKMQLGAADLIDAGQRAQFFMIPCAGHGEFGPEAERVMAQILGFVGSSPEAARDSGSD